MNLKIFTRMRGKTLEGVAEACGVTKTAVSQWSRGSTLPTYDKFLKLLEYFGLSKNSVEYKKPLSFQKRLVFGQDVEVDSILDQLRERIESGKSRNQKVSFD